MKANREIRITGPSNRTAAHGTLLALILAFTAIHQIAAVPNIVVWDTGSKLTEADVATRTGWKAVPTELFALEAEPLKAASDPGYYGREYSFKGDTIVENQNLTAVFWSSKGRVIIYSKPGGASPPAASSASVGPGSTKKILELVPLASTDQPGGISRCDILRNAGDEVVLKVSFSGKTKPDVSATFTFGKSEIVEVKPAGKGKEFRIFSPLERAVIPGFVGDDLVFNPADYASADTLTPPSENLLLGLIGGEAHELVMTWPTGRQRLALRLANDSSGQRTIESVDFDSDGQSFYVAALRAPGIWHREELKPGFLEKDVASGWKRPFPAKWKTHLLEAGVRTTFAFREAKGTVWRGVPGSYNYPVWFDGETAWYHLSKKVPPKGESLIYFLEGQNTPVAVTTPVDIMKATLGRAMSEPILDAAGQKLRTHHRRGGDGVHRACTCGCTDAIQAFFEKGQEVAKKDSIKDALGDMNFFVDCHVDRIEEYRRFANDLIHYLNQKGTASPELKPFLEKLGQIVEQIPQEYTVQKENMKSRDYATDLTRRTMELTGNRNTNNLPAYMDLLKAWRAMGGAQDYVVAQCHVITRKLFQEAGYGCATEPKALAVAQEVRARCRQVLRNPDGYEIWANY